MRHLLAGALFAIAAPLTLILTIALVLSGGGDAATAACNSFSGPVDTAAVLATIRQLESGGSYTARNASSTASGAYQFTDPTWNRFENYPRALDAPPAVQDSLAGDTVNATFGLALAAGASFYEAARLANYAGGLVVMKRGTATVTSREIGDAIEVDIDTSLESWSQEGPEQGRRAR